MTTYRIASIFGKAQRTGWGQSYIDDCRALATEWDEAAGTATYTDAALAEIRATWNEAGKPAKNQQHKPCKNCGGL